MTGTEGKRHNEGLWVRSGYIRSMADLLENSCRSGKFLMIFFSPSAFSQANTRPQLLESYRHEELLVPPTMYGTYPTRPRRGLFTS